MGSIREVSLGHKAIALTRKVTWRLHQEQNKHRNTICPPMAWTAYRNLSERDTWLIVAYLKAGIKPVKNEVPENTTPQGTRPDCTPLYQNLQPLPAYPGKNEIGVWQK